MIDDSVPWKCDLAKDIQSTRARLNRYRKATYDGLSDRTFYKIERFCFLTPFIIRKLIEAEKLSQEFKGIEIPLYSYKKRNHDYSQLDVLTKGNVDKRYILDVSALEKVGIRNVCNMLIHSTDILFCIDESREIQILFTSKHNREHLFEIPVRMLVNIASSVVRDDIVVMNYKRENLDGPLKSVVRSKVAPTSRNQHSVGRGSAEAVRKN